MSRPTLLVWMTAASVINYVGRTVMAVAGPEVAKEYHLTEAQLGEIFSAFWLGYGLMMWPSGWLADRYGAARVLAICGVMTAFLTLGTTLATTLFLFLAIRFLFGMASAVIYPACANITTQSFRPETYAGVQGLVVGGGSLGTAITPLIVVAMTDWRAATQMLAMATLGFFLLWWWRVPAQGQASAAPPFRLNRTTILLGFQSFCVGYYYNFTDTWAFYYFQEVRRFPTEQSALFTFLLQLTGGLAMPLGGYLMDRIAPYAGRLRPGIVVLTLAAVCVAAGAAAEAPLTVLTLLSVSYGLTVGMEGLYSWGVLESTPDAPGSAYGYTNMVGSAAQFLAPLVFPWLAARGGWVINVYSAAAALTIGALLWYAAISRLNTCSDRSRP